MDGCGGTCEAWECPSVGTPTNGGKTRGRCRGTAGALGTPSAKTFKNCAKCSGEKRLKNIASHSKSIKPLFELRKSGLATVAGNCRGITCCELTTPSVYCLWSAIFHHSCAIQSVCAPLRSKTGKGRPLFTATLGAEKRRTPRNRSYSKSADA